MRRFFTFFSMNSLQRIFPEPSGKPKEEPKPLTPEEQHTRIEAQLVDLIETHETRMNAYVKANEDAIKVLVQNGRFKEDDKFIVDMKKHIIEMQAFGPKLGE